MKKFAILFNLLISVISLQAQTSRTWTGSTSTDWNTAANWSPSGVPSSSDHIVLNNGSLANMPLLDANRSITNITVTAGTMNLNGYTLTVTGTTSLTGGQINNGVMQFSNTTTAIAGTTFGAAVNISSGAVTVTNSTFNSPVSIAKSGSSADSWAGGNTFNSTLDISLTNGSVDLVNYLTGNTYNDNITVSNTGSGRIRFNAYTATSTLTSGKTIAIGSGGYNSGTLTINGIAISGSTAQSFTLTGTSTLNLANIIFGGTVSISSPNFNLGYSTFNGAVSVTKNGSGTASWEAGNTFNSTLDVNVIGGNLNLNSWTNANTFNDNVTISNTGSGTVKLSSYSNTNYLASGKTISVGSGGFASGNLYINNVSQTGTTAQNFTVTGSAGLFIETSTWGGNITATGPSVNLNGGTYNGTVIVNKNGSTTAGWGGCTFNSTLDVNVSAGSLNLTSWVYGNNYNDNVTVSNTGSGTINFNSYAAASYLASGKTITVGSGGFATGTLTISGITQSATTAQNFTVTGTAALNINSSTWGGAITATGPSVTIGGGSTFNGAVTVYKNGSTANGWAGTGANTFNSALDINVSNGNLDLAGWTFNNTYNGNVTISNTGGGTIRFNGYTNTSTLAAGKTISIGTGGFASGNLYINGITQSGSTAQNITLTGTSASLYLTNSTFNGAIIASAPNVISGGSTFNSDFTVTKSSSSTNSWTANTYNGNVSITNTGSGYINMSNVVSGGDVYNGNATFTKSGTGDVIIAGSGSTVTFKVNVTLNNISSNQFTGSQVALFTGTAAQTLNQSSSTLNFGRITINKASNNLTLNAPLTVSTALTLTSGKIITTSTNLLNLADNATVSSASNSSYVQGPMSKTGNDAFTFPTGKAGSYRPIGISAPSSTATIFTAEYVDANQTLGTSTDTSIANLSDCEHWTLTRSGSTSNVNVTLAWNSASCNGAVATNMHVAGWNGTAWTNYGNGIRTGNATAGTVTSNTNPTAYNAFAMTNKNCTGVATITPSGATSFCSGGSVTLTAPAGAKKYSWLPSGITQSINASASNSYIVKVADTLGCVGKDTVDVTVWANPTVSAGSDTVIVVGDTIQLNATVSSGTSPYSYLWTPSTGLSSTTVANPFAHPDTLTDYIVRVTDANGCVKRDTVRVSPYLFSLTTSADTIYIGDTLIANVLVYDTTLSYVLRWGNNCNDTINIGYNDKICDVIFYGNSELYKRYNNSGTFSIIVSGEVEGVVLRTTKIVTVLPITSDVTESNCNIIINPCFNSVLIDDNGAANDWPEAYSDLHSLHNWTDFGANLFFGAGSVNTVDAYSAFSPDPVNYANPGPGPCTPLPITDPDFTLNDDCSRNFVGLATYVEDIPDHREMIYQTVSVTPNVTYRLTFFANRAYACGYSTELTARFNEAGNIIDIPLTVVSGDLTQHNNWSKLEGFFTPTSSLIQLGIGSLPGNIAINQNDAEPMYVNNVFPTGEKAAYYYLIAVKLIPQATMDLTGCLENICSGTELNLSSGFSTPNDNDGVNWTVSPFDPTLFGQTNNVDINVTPSFLPSSPNTHQDPTTGAYYTTYTYTVTADLNGCELSETCVVNVYDFITVPIVLDGPDDNCDPNSIYTVSPLPSTGAVITWDVPSGATYVVNEDVSPVGSSIIVDWGANYIGGQVSVTVSNPACSTTVDVDVAPCCSREHALINPKASDLPDLIPEFASVDPITGAVIVSSGFTNLSSPGTEIAVLGTLTIDVALVFKNANIVFARNSKVVFPNNSNAYKFRIEDSWLHNCDGYLWDGMYTTRKNCSIYIYSSLIQDARNALVSKNRGDFRILDGTTFSKNYKHVVVSSANSPHPAIIHSSTFSGISAPLPASPAIIPTPLRTDVAFEISKVMRINIGQSGENPNVITNSNVGVRSFISNTYLTNNDFDSFGLLTGVSNQQGIAIYSAGLPSLVSSINVVGTSGNENTFNACNMGVFANNSVLVNIDGNIFTNGYTSSTGIKVSNNVNHNINIANNSITKYTTGIAGVNNRQSNVHISANYIDLTASAPSAFATGISWAESYTSLTNATANVLIDYNTIVEARLGIHTSNLSPCRIEYNNVLLKGTLQNFSLFGNTIPLSNWGINNSRSVWPVLYANKVNGQLQNDRVENFRFSQSYLAFNMCNVCNDNSSYYSGKGILYDQSPISYMAGNEMRNHNEGLYLRNMSDIGPQGSPTSPNDNKWNGTNFVIGGTYVDNFTFGPSSPFTVRSGTPFESPLNAGSDAIPFANTASGEVYTCPKSFSRFNEQVRNFAGPIVEDTLTYLSFQESMRYLNRSTLYDIIEAYADSFTADTAMNDYAKDVGDEPFANLATVSKKMTVDYFDDVFTLPDTVFAARDSAEFITPQYTRTRSFLTAARTLNNGITPTAVPDSIGKIFRSIVLTSALHYDSLLTALVTAGTDTVLDDFENINTDRYDSVQIANLIDIALLCPLVYGTDVYSARAELMTINDSLMRTFIAYVHPCESDGVSARKANPNQEDKIKSATISIYPNPTTGDLYIVNPGDKMLQLEILSPLGQLVYKQQINVGSNYLSLNTIVNGIYLVRISNSESIINNQKLIINR